MMDYYETLKDLFESYEEELGSALNGNIEKYCYSEAVSDEYGTHDANYTNRLKLAYTILYTEKYKEHSRIGGLILKLYTEELIDRETNDFQGIGSCLNVLSVLMNEYDIPVREELFERAKNANFDCSLGFSNPEEYINKSLSDYDKFDTVSILIELEENELALKLLKQDIESNEIVDENMMRFYKNCFHNLNDIDGEIDIEKKLLNMLILSSDNLSICSCMLDLIKTMNSIKRYNEASQIFDMLIPRLHSIDDWYSIGLGRQSLEQCMDIILHCDELSEDLWEWAEPFLKKIVDNMHGNLYKKASLAAFKMGDFQFAENLSERYDELMLSVNKIHIEN